MKVTTIAATVLLAGVAIASSAAAQVGANVRCVGEACGPIVGDEKFDMNQRREVSNLHTLRTPRVSVVVAGQYLQCDAAATREEEEEEAPRSRRIRNLGSN